MPLQKCQEDGRPGWKWGDAGKCYTYTPGNEASEKAAKQKALNQGIAIGDIDAQRGRQSWAEMYRTLARIRVRSTQRSLK